MYDEDTKLSDLCLSPWLLSELHQLGYERAGDMRDLPRELMLRIPGMGGAGYKRICAALGREPFALPQRRKRN